MLIKNHAAHSGHAEAGMAGIKPGVRETMGCETKSPIWLATVGLNMFKQHSEATKTPQRGLTMAHG
jgi:hypothetical protein